MPLQTAGERALFAELARWDTGGAVRGAVVASIPLVTDGALQRRISDAVLIVPEGIAVMRIVGVERQSGIVTVKPEGAWTIAPGAGPGEVLQLSGGGSTPLDGLMRAGMDAAVRLRRAGLEPGRIARLTVLVGELTGLQPPDGDLGEGDQVALVEPRSLLLGIARASRYAGVDNPRLWTTADVRAALEALGLQGRGPSVEELNGEGFPYSPYVLRRPELLTPAAMTAASTAPPEQPAARPPAAPVPASAVAPVPMAAAQTLQAFSAPAPVQHQAPSGDPFAGRPERDTIAVGSAEPADDTGGIGGLFSSAEPVDPQLPPVPPAGPRTAVLTEPPQWDAAPQAWEVPPAPPTRPAPGRPAATPGGRSHRRGILLVAASLLVLALVAVGGLLVLSGALHGTSGTGGSAVTSSTRSAAPTLAAGHTQQVDGVTFTLQATRTDTTCAGHAYGQVAGFFASSDCSALSRGLYSAQIAGHTMVAAISHVPMPTAAAAVALRKLTDATGTGNVSDLLREGVRYAGGPVALKNSEYSSDVNGTDVTIVETSWVDPASVGSSQQLDAAANSGLVLDLPAFPAR
jgi:hypothetical protein